MSESALLTETNVVRADDRERKPLPHRELEPRARFVLRKRDEAIRWRDGVLQMIDRWRSARSWVLSTGQHRSGLTRSRTYVNHIYEKLESLGAHLTDALPSFRYQAPVRSRVRLARLLNRSAPTIWARERGSRVFRETVKSALKNGNHYWYIGHEPAGPDRPPRIRIHDIPPWRVFPAPYSTSPETAPWFHIAIPRTVEEIWRDYRIRVEPDDAPHADLRGIEEDLATVDRQAPVYGARPDSTDPTTTHSGEVPLHPSNFLGTDTQRPGIVWQWILFIRDAAEENRYGTVDTKEGMEIAWGPERKYPNGRLMSVAGNRLLFDRPNPYPDTGLVHFRDVTVEDFWFGIGEVPNLIPLQLLHDDMMENIRLIHRFMSNGRLIIDKTTGLRPGEIGNDPDEIWWTQNNTQDRVRIQDGIVPRQEFYGYLGFLEQQFDLLTGHSEALRGTNPPNVQAARHFGQLQRAAAARVRSRMRDIEEAMVEAGRMIARRVQQFYPSYTEARISDDRFETLELTDEDRQGDFDIEVNLIANLEEMRDAEFRKMLLFHGMGMVLDERLLEESGLSATQALLAELPAARHIRAIQQQAALAAGQGGGSAPIMSASEAAQSATLAQRNVQRALRGEAR